MKSTIKNAGLLKVLHIALRTAVLAIASEFEKQYGAKNTQEKLFITINPKDEQAYLAGIRGELGDEKRAEARKGIAAVAVGYVEEDGTTNFKEPQLFEVIMSIVGSKTKKVFVNLEWSNGCLVIDSGKSFAPKGAGIAQVAKAAQPKTEVVAEPKKRAPKKRAPKKKSENENHADAPADKDESED